jgi:hypothetical protein
VTAAEQAKAERARAIEAEMVAMRLRVAMRLGLTEAHAARFQGRTEWEVEAEAAELFGTPEPEGLSEALRRKVERPQVEEEAAPPPLRSGVQAPMALNSDQLLESVKRKLGIGRLS